MAFSFFKSKKEVSAKPGVNDVVELEVQKIIPNRYQPRKLFSDESIAELATTIAEHGLLQPIVVREYETDKYEIIAGERRFRAVNRLKWEKIPALIKKMDDTQAASMAVIENLQREGLSAIEEAQSYQKLMELNQLTQLQLAREIGKSQSFVANKLRLLKLNMGVQRAILNRKLTERHGRALVSLDDKQQVELLKQIEEGKLLLTSGKEIASDMLILAAGVRPETSLVEKAGIKLTDKGLIITNAYMQTNFADIYACGDNVAVKDFVSGQPSMIALAGPANRQGRLIADHIANNHPYPYTGSQGTGIVKVFGLTAAFTGNNEKQLQRNNIPYEKMIILANSHAGYYPGAESITLKVLYSHEGKILGAQAVGKEGVDKRIDVIATIMRLNGTTADLRDAELCYAPPYSGAKDPVNLIGMAIENARQGLVKPYFGTTFDDMVILDVRPPQIYAKEHIEGAINIPAGQIRSRLNELPKDKTIMVHCFKGYTSYVVVRILLQNGFDKILSYAGGWNFYKSLTD